MNENPFKALSTDQTDLIEDAYREGQSPDDIGIKFGLDYDDVRFYCENFITPPKSRFERLHEIVSDLEEVTNDCKRSIDGSQASGNASAIMMQSYQRLMAEYRMATAEMDEMKVPSDVVGEVVEKILNPFVIDLARTSTEETNKLKEELINLDVPPRDAQNIATDVFKRLMVSVKVKMISAEDDLNAYYGVKKKKRKAFGS